MEQNKRKRSGRSATKIIPPKKKKTENLSRDEVRSINKKKIRRKRKAKRFALLAGGIVDLLKRTERIVVILQFGIEEILLFV